MRILHVITRLMLGGAQENTVLSCEDMMRDNGDDVLLVTGPPLGSEGDLIPRARAGGIPMEMIPELRRSIHPVRDLVAYRKIKRIIKEFKPDVVHTHSAKAGMLGRAAAWKLGVPAVIHSVHGAPFHPYQNGISRSFFRKCERWAAKRCHHMISVADAMTDLLVDGNVAPREKFTTIYSGMEVEQFLESGPLRESVRRELGYKPEHIVVGKIARLFHLKGHKYLFQAARPIIDQCPNVRFLIIGSGVLWRRFEDEVQEAGLADYFQFLGLAPRERIPELISAMDIVVHLSLREGLARVLPQALLAGKPVVSYDVDGAREVVVTGETGYLLPPESQEPLIDAMVQLASDPELRDRLGAEGRRRCEPLFDHRNMSQQIRTVYEEVLSRQG